MTRRSLLQWFYWLTPAFVLLDWLMGWNIRVAGLNLDSHRNLYYAVCLGIAGILWWRPAWTTAISLVECSVNFALLIIGVYTGYLGTLDRAANGEMVSLFGTADLINLLLVGSIMIIGIQQANRRLFEHRSG